MIKKKETTKKVVITGLVKMSVKNLHVVANNKYFKLQKIFFISTYNKNVLHITLGVGNLPQILKQHKESK